MVLFEAANFLGAKLADLLLERGYSIYTIDSLSHAADTYLAKFDYNRNFKRIPIGDFDNGLLDKASIKAVYYMGVPICFSFEQMFPVQILDANNRITKTALDLSDAAKAVFINVSRKNTCNIPGIAGCKAKLPTKILNQACKFSEALSRQARENNGTDIKLVRVYNCYGENMLCSFISPIPALVAQALNGGILRIFDNGQEMQSFCYSGDVAKALAQIPDSNASLVLNLANPVKSNIADIAGKIASICGKGDIISINSNTQKSYTDNDFEPDISHAVDTLNWNPNTSIDEGLLATVNSFTNGMQPCMGPKFD